MDMIFRYFSQEPFVLAPVLALSGIAGGLVAYAINTNLKKWKASDCTRSLICGGILAFAIFILSGIAFEEVFVLEDHSLDLAAASCCCFVFSMIIVHLIFKHLMRIGTVKKRTEPPLRVKRD